MANRTLPAYTLHEERANCCTHGIGFFLAIGGLVALSVFAAARAEMWSTISVIVYGITLVLLYATSTSYHATKNRRIKKVFRLLDHSAIYIFIAGCYTPLMLVVLHGELGFAMTGLVWSVAIVGVIVTILFMERMKNMAVLLYVAMAGIVMFVIKPLAIALPSSGLFLLLGSGLAYGVGLIFYLVDRIPYNHALWHVCVLVGSVAHFTCVFKHVLLNQ